MKSKLFLTLMLLLSVVGWARADELTIYEGATGTNSYVPVYGMWADSYQKCEFIIPAEELNDMDNAIISEMTFYLNQKASAAWTGTFQVFLKEVGDATISNYTGTNGATIVYEGTLDATGETMTVAFSSEYLYAGGNLLVGVYEIVPGSYAGASFFGANVAGASVGGYNSAGLDAVSANARNFIPKTTFTYTAGEAPSCVKPKSLTVNYTGGTTAVVSWTSDAEAWILSVNGTETAVTENSYTLTELALGTTYEIKVRTDCGGGDLSDWTNPVSFTTDFCLEEEQCLVNITLTDAYSDGGGSIKVVDAETEKVLGSFTCSGASSEYTLSVCPGREINFVFASTDSYSYENGWVITDVNNEVISEHVGCRSSSDCTAPTNGVIATYLVDCTIATCPRPTEFAVNFEGGVTAEVSWTSDADSFDLMVNDEVIEGVSSPYTLEDLELSTTYEVMVRANCGGGDYSSWTPAVTFTTDACLNPTVVNYSLQDSYGDGWVSSNGANYIVMMDEADNILDYVTVESGYSASGTFKTCGEYVKFMWYIQGSNTYPGECSWTFTDESGNELFSGTGSSVENGDILYVIDRSSFPSPSNLAVSEVGPHSAVLGWTENGEATAWEICLNGDEDKLIAAESNPFTLTGLDSETTYVVKVRAINGSDQSRWSPTLTFATPITNPAPSDLAVTNISASSATVNWSSFAESYDLEWAEYTYTPSDNAFWLQYDNGTVASNVGSSSVMNWKWGVMYPADMLQDQKILTKIAFYEAEANQYTDGTITVNVYSGGDDAPGTLIGTESFAIEGTNGMREVNLSVPIEFDPSQNLWITLNTNALHCMGMSNEDGGINSRWIFYENEWMDMGSLYTTGAAYSFMIRGYADNFDLSTLNWNTEPDVTSPYTIDGLDPVTPYIVRVRGDYGEDGISNWASKIFTTSSPYDDPIDLAATEITATTATLDWTGYQDSYNLMYRQAEAIDPSEPATIIFEANDVWGDGSGYQMLLDADANVYGTLWNANHNILVDGEQYSSGDIPAEYYDEFEYKLPEEADGALSTTNVVVTGSVTMYIPAGTYDYAIFNPTPGDKFYIASDNGEVGGAEDDFVFEPGVTYRFTMQRFGTGDGAALEIIRPMEEWITVEGISNPYEMTDLTPNTYYEWQVQGVYEGGTTEWVGSHFATEELLEIELVNDDSENDAEKKNSVFISDAAGQYCEVLLSDRTLFKDNSWNTLCLPFDLTLDGSILEGATAKTLEEASVSGTSITLGFGSPVSTLEAGIPYIIKWEGGDNLVDPIFSNVLIKDVSEDDRTITLANGNVKFTGYYDAFEITPDDEGIYYMKADNTLAHTAKARTLKALRAYFEFTEEALEGARSIVLDLGEGSQATSISSLPADMLGEGDWYTVSGMKVTNLKKGVYINNGKKVVIK